MKKKIIISVSLGIVALLAIATLILALVPVNKNTVIAKPNSIYITNKNTKEFGGNCAYDNIQDITQNGSAMLNDFYKAFNESFEQKALVAMFTDQSNSGIKANCADVAGSSVKISKNYDTTEKFTVIFQYNDNQTIYVEEKDLSFEYNYLFFEVTNADERQEVTFGVMKDNYYLDGSHESLPYKYYFTAQANLKPVYQYINTISIFSQK